MKVRSAPLEDWLRDYYFTAEYDISSSGVQPYSMGELRTMTGLRQADLDELVLTDGHSLGSPGLRSIIAGRWSDGDPARVMTTNGSSESISLILMALLRPGATDGELRARVHAAIGAIQSVLHYRSGLAADHIDDLIAASAEAVLTDGLSDGLTGGR